MPGTLSRQVYGREELIEEFSCNYGLNPAYRDQICSGGLRIAGLDPDGEVRIVELSDHPYFIATLFLPQLSSKSNMPHPLILGYLRAAQAFSSNTHK
jgi:CTP synthase (UTP-ammonia lyase)